MSAPVEPRELAWHVSDRLTGRTPTSAPALEPVARTRQSAGRAVNRRDPVDLARRLLSGRWLVWRIRRFRNRSRARVAARAARVRAISPVLRVPVQLASGPSALGAAARNDAGSPTLDLARLSPRLEVVGDRVFLEGAWLPLHAPHRLPPAGFPQLPDTGSMRLSALSGRRLAPRGRRRLVAAARHHQAVDCSGLALAPAAAADVIVDLAGAGVALVAARVDPGVAALLGPELVAVIERGARLPLADQLVRERHSIALRDVVHRQLSSYAGLAALARDAGLEVVDVPTVSILLSTNRPAMVEFAVDQIARQDYPGLEVLCGLHGFALDPAARERVEARLPGVHLVEVGTELDLGQVLAHLGARASGDLVTKWDDDDWYAYDHLRDLVDALRYSGAAVVGKAAEFVHLTSLDLTMRRFATGSESMSTTVAGGTLMLASSTLRDLGGWPAGPKRVDRLLIEAAEAHGGPTYRTHGSGYLLRRDSHPGTHTWQVEDDYFLRQAVDQRPGLDLEFAGVTA